MSEFIIQQESTGHGPIVSPEGAALLDALRYQDWLAGEQRHRVILAETPAGQPLDAIPVGSVEFVNTHLREYGYPGLCWETIPECLRIPELLGRSVSVGSVSGTELPHGNRLFVKPAVSPKAFEAQVVPRAMLSSFEGKGQLFISELLPDIVSEWRVFIRAGTMFDLRPYAYASWPVVPDKQAVQRIMDCYDNQPSVYTLDVAVLSNNRTVLIETHPFIAVGLYGFESPALPSMYARAWREYLSFLRSGGLSG